MRASTRAIHGRREPGNQPITPPIYQTAAFAVDSNEDFDHISEFRGDDYFYSRYDNPTLRHVSMKLAALEQGEECLLFASGMTAITTVLMSLLRSGDTIAASNALYGGTLHFLQEYAPRYGIHVLFLSDEEMYAVNQHAPQAKVVYFETPVNPRTDCLSIRRVVEAAQRIGALIVKDNTFATPLNQRPLDLGVDLVIHSLTKYLGGHSDVTAGAVIGSRALIEPIFAARKVFGGIPSPHDAFLLDRSLKTFELRMGLHNSNALALAQYLESEPRVRQVFYPGLPSSPSYAVACEQMSGFGGMLCITLDDLDTAKALSERLQLALNVAHLGSAETMVSIPVLTSHAMLSEDALHAAGLTPGMVRISVGLEHIDDIIGDFQQALAGI